MIVVIAAFVLAYTMTRSAMRLLERLERRRIHEPRALQLESPEMREERLKAAAMYERQEIVYWDGTRGEYTRPPPMPLPGPGMKRLG